MTAEERINKAFSKAAEEYEANAIVQRQMAIRLASLLPEGLEIDTAFEFGTGTGLLTKQIDCRCKVKHWLLNDLSDNMLRTVPALSGEVTFLQGDVVTASIGDQIGHPQLIASSAALQWIAEPFALLEQLTARLQPNGHLLIGTFEEGNLAELAALTGNSLPYFSKEDLEHFAKAAHLHIQFIESESITLSFPSPKEVLMHLKKTGTTQLPHWNNETPRLNTRSALSELDRSYRRYFSSADGSAVLLSYTPLYLYATK